MNYIFIFRSPTFNEENFKKQTPLFYIPDNTGGIAKQLMDSSKAWVNELRKGKN